MFDAITSVTQNILLDNGMATIVQNQIAIQVQEVDSDHFDGMKYAVATNSDGVLNEDSLSGIGETTATIPDDLLVAVPNAERVGFGVFTNDSFFVQKSSVPLRVRSVIVSFDVYTDNGIEEMTNLETPVTFTFTASISTPLLCVFYDTC